MSNLLCIPEEKMEVTSLSIDLASFKVDSKSSSDRSANLKLGYLARIAPEKGLHNLVAAFIELAKRPEYQGLTLEVAGWLGEHQRDYFEHLKTEIQAAGLLDRFQYHGSPDLNEKVKLLDSFDVTCVPTDYEDPKGLFVLESLAAGTPVVLPKHGAFPELVTSTGGGLLFEPGDLSDLVSQISCLLQDEELRHRLSQEGQDGVRLKHSIESAAEQMKKICFNDSNSRESIGCNQ
jgi:glycosyltransferase involved in cell wall biosynthesis